MPFETTNSLPDDPHVRIFFTGLLILDANPQPGPEVDEDPAVKKCEVFVLRSAPDHRLSIQVTRKRKGKPDIIRMRTPDELSYIAPGDDDPVGPRFGVFIRVIKNPKGVKKYVPGPGDTSTEGETLDLAIDLEKLTPQQGNVGAVNPLDARPSILLNHAVLYTADRSSDEAKINLIKNGTVVGPLSQFARVIGANIYLEKGDPDSNVVIAWVEKGLRKTLTLRQPKPDQENFTYEIRVTNEPLYEEEESTLPAHDELKEYFKILPAAAERFELEVEENDPEHERGSTTTPCMPVTKGG